MAILIKPQNGEYINSDAIENTLRYITRARANEDRKHELILYGSPNVLIYGENGIVKAIEEFTTVQRYYHGFYIKGPKVYHEVLRFSAEESELFMHNTALLDSYALACSRIYAELGFQVVYAVHFSKDKGLHIHFICNAVSYVDGLKWHFSIKDQKEREFLFNQLIHTNGNNLQYSYPVCFPYTEFVNSSEEPL